MLRQPFPYNTSLSCPTAAAIEWYFIFKGWFCQLSPQAARPKTSPTFGDSRNWTEGISILTNRPVRLTMILGLHSLQHCKKTSFFVSVSQRGGKKENPLQQIPNFCQKSSRNVFLSSAENEKNSFQDPLLKFHHFFVACVIKSTICK